MADFNVIDSFKIKFPKSKVIRPSTGEYSKKFINYNKKVVKQGLTDNIVYDPTILYNKNTNRFVGKNKYYKKNGGIRKKFNNDDFMVEGDTFSRPSIYVENEIRPLIIGAEQTKEGFFHY